VLETDNFRGGKPKVFKECQPQGAERKAEILAFVLSVTHENRQMTALCEHRMAVPNDAAQPSLKIDKGRGIGETTWVIAVANHFPIRWVKPNEVEFSEPLIPLFVLSIEASVEVKAPAGNA